MSAQILLARRMMLSNFRQDYAITSAESPQIMEMMYNAGFAKHAEYITVSEAAKVTNAQFSSAFGRKLEEASLFQMAEPFDGFRYFTGLTETANALFRGAKVTSIVLPPNITETKANLLRDYSFPNGVIELPNIVTIGVWNFASMKCYKLVIGEHVTSIGQYSFRFTQIPYVIILATTPPTMGATQPTSCTFYVPDESVEAYKAATNWSNYADRIKPLSDYYEQDQRIKLLFHFDGNYTEERGHTFRRNNTYYDGTYADGVFGQCPWNASGGFNFQINDVFTKKPNKFTFSFWCYNDGTGNTDVIIGLCRPTGGGGWSSFYKTSGLCIYCLPRSRRLLIAPNGDYDSRRQDTATQTAPSNQWAHYAVTYDNGLISWYCDGNRVGQMQIDHENDFVYKGNDFGLHNWNKCDEIMFADDLLIEGETYTVPTKPYK